MKGGEGWVSHNEKGTPHHAIRGVHQCLQMKSGINRVLCNSIANRGDRAHVILAFRLETDHRVFLGVLVDQIFGLPSQLALASETPH